MGLKEDLRRQIEKEEREFYWVREIKNGKVIGRTGYATKAEAESWIDYIKEFSESKWELEDKKEEDLK